MEIPEKDCIASPISHHLPTDISWKLKPYSQERERVRHFSKFPKLTKKVMAFPHFV